MMSDFVNVYSDGVHSTLDRMAHARKNKLFIEEKLQNPSTKFLPFWKFNALVRSLPSSTSSSSSSVTVNRALLPVTTQLEFLSQTQVADFLFPASKPQLSSSSSSSSSASSPASSSASSPASSSSPLFASPKPLTSPVPSIFLGMENSSSSSSSSSPTAVFAIDVSAAADVNQDQTIKLTELESSKKKIRSPELVQSLKSQGVQWMDVRSASMRCSSAEAPLLAQARALFFWHSQNTHCGSCGSLTVASSGGHTRDCTSSSSCKRQLFPRIDPCVIMAVHNKTNDKLLLARQSSFLPNVLSVVAGFMEVSVISCF
jgi:NADH pyrophosphatase NudC (nudix superfamily)